MFVVMKRFGRGPEARVKEFAKETDAVAFILEKLREDQQFKMNTVYGLYEGADLVRELTENDLPKTASAPGADSESGSASQKGSGQSFRPSPFNTAPRLGPQTGLKDTSRDDENKDK